MRGIDVFQETLFTTVQLDSFISADHPLRWIRAIIDQSLTQIDWLMMGWNLIRICNLQEQWA